MLYDDGLHEDNLTNDGIYAHAFTNTSLWGSYYITVAANGSLNGEDFARYAFTAAWVEQYPDLALNESDIGFSQETATEGDIVTITATIHNLGEVNANNASILFCDGNPANGTLLGESIIDVISGEAEIASVQWSATHGEHEIYVVVSAYNEFLELNYTNNEASRTMEVAGHDLAVLAITAVKTVVGQTSAMSIDVAVENQGDFQDDFNVTLHANTTVIGGANVASVPNGTWTILTFTWNTTLFARGNYAIRAYIDPAPNETRIENNDFTHDEYVLVTIAGDVTSATGPPDGIVDMRDLALLCVHFMRTPSHPDWDPNMDINDDLIVNMRDISTACSNFLRT